MRHPIATLPRTEPELAAWLHEQYARKDRFLAAVYSGDPQAVYDDGPSGTLAHGVHLDSHAWHTGLRTALLLGMLLPFFTTGRAGLRAYLALTVAGWSLSTLAMALVRL